MSEAISNPLSFALFLPALKIIAWSLLFGFLIILVLSRFDLRKMFNGELGLRFIGWLIVVPVFLLSLFGGSLVAALVLLFCLNRLIEEYSEVVQLPNDYRLFLHIQAAFTLFIVVYFPFLFSGITGLAILLLTLFPILHNNPTQLNTYVSHTLRGYIYVVWTTSHAILLRGMENGLNMVVIAAFSVALADIGAYIVGKAIGRHKIASKVSPNKAYEGLLGNALGVMVGFYLLKFAFPPGFSLGLKIIYGLLLTLGSSWGDLASSLAKRAAGVKDWGRSLPGHGGLLDRLNSSLVTIPATYYFLLFLTEYGWI